MAGLSDKLGENMSKYLKITKSELECLIECADTCSALSGDLEYEGRMATNAYTAVLKRNNLSVDADYSETEQE